MSNKNETPKTYHEFKVGMKFPISGTLSNIGSCLNELGDLLNDIQEFTGGFSTPIHMMTQEVISFIRGQWWDEFYKVYGVPEQYHDPSMGFFATHYIDSNLVEIKGIPKEWENSGVNLVELLDASGIGGKLPPPSLN